MALKDNWKDLVNGESEIDANPINEIANSVIELEDSLGSIDDALDSIIALQNSLIGGDSV